MRILHPRFAAVQHGKQADEFIHNAKSLCLLQSGLYWLLLLENYVATWPLVIIAFFEVTVIGWVYGADNFLGDIKWMTHVNERRVKNRFREAMQGANLLVEVFIVGIASKNACETASTRPPLVFWFTQRFAARAGFFYLLNSNQIFFNKVTHCIAFRFRFYL